MLPRGREQAAVLEPPNSILTDGYRPPQHTLYVLPYRALQQKLV